MKPSIIIWHSILSGLYGVTVRDENNQKIESLSTEATMTHDEARAYALVVKADHLPTAVIEE